MKCRIGCGACCIAISISSPIPNMPHGKKAGTRCVNLAENRICSIHGTAVYPEVCRNLQPDEEMCGDSYEEAFEYLCRLESMTMPN